MPRIHLVVGPVGAGKSTWALALAEEHRAVRVSLDEWMTELFRPDRPAEGVVAWYRERAARCIEVIWTMTTRLLDAGTDVVLEIGLLERDERARFYERVEARGAAMTIHVVDADRDVRRARVMRRNEERGGTFSMVVPMEVFEFASDLWQSVDEDECVGREVRFRFTDVDGGP